MSELKKLSLTDFDALIADDLIKLLNLKGFENFRSFEVAGELKSSKNLWTFD